jgi:vancomycin permeability regulator SanA
MMTPIIAEQLYAACVLPGDITLDYAGFSTYESCYRAQVIFGVTQVVRSPSATICRALSTPAAT